MAVENLRGQNLSRSESQFSQVRRPVISKDEPSFLQDPVLVDPNLIEIVNVGLLEKKKPFRRTRLMQRVEKEQGGKPIEEILPELYLGQNKSHVEVAEHLGIGTATAFIWIHATGVEVRSLSDSSKLFWKKRKEAGKIPVKKVENTRTKIKYREAKEKLAIDSDEHFKAHLEEIYREHKSLEATAKTFSESGIKIGSLILKNWMSNLGIQWHTIRLEENNKRFVEKAYNSRAFLRLTPNQREAIRLTYIEGRTFKEAADIIGTKNRQVVWDRVNRGLDKLRKILFDADEIQAAS